MNFSRITAALWLWALCTLAASGGDSIPDVDNPIKFARATDADRAVLKAARVEEPGKAPAPAFVVKTANSDFVMTIGGEINPILGWDIGNNLYKQSGPASVS